MKISCFRTSVSTLKCQNSRRASKPLFLPPVSPVTPQQVKPSFCSLLLSNDYSCCVLLKLNTFCSHWQMFPFLHCRTTELIWLWLINVTQSPCPELFARCGKSLMPSEVDGNPWREKGRILSFVLEHYYISHAIRRRSTNNCLVHEMMRNLTKSKVSKSLSDEDKKR